jgi:hypothetical protein
LLAFKLLAGAPKALDHEAVANFLEVGGSSVEAGGALHDRQRDVVRSAAAHLQAQIERNSDVWLRTEFGSDPSGQADAAAAIAALDDILPKCLPDGLSVAQANLDTERIASLVVAKAASGDEMFREGTFGGRLLLCLVQGAYQEAKRDRDFAAVIGIPVQEVLLGRTEQLVAGQSAMQQQLAELLARFPSQIAAASTEYRLPREVVDRLLMTAGLADIEPERVPWSVRGVGAPLCGNARRLAAAEQSRSRNRHAQTAGERRADSRRSRHGRAAAGGNPRATTDTVGATVRPIGNCPNRVLFSPHQEFLRANGKSETTTSRLHQSSILAAKHGEIASEPDAELSPFDVSRWPTAPKIENSGAARDRDAPYRHL